MIGKLTILVYQDLSKAQLSREFTTTELTAGMGFVITTSELATVVRLFKTNTTFSKQYQYRPSENTYYIYNNANTILGQPTLLYHIRHICTACSGEMFIINKTNFVS